MSGQNEDFLDEVASGFSEDFNSSATGFCASETFYGNFTSILPIGLAITMRIVQVLVGSTYIFFGTTLNTLVLVLVLKFKKLRTVSFAIASQIAVANLLSTVMFCVPTVVNHMADRWLLGLPMCILSVFLIFSSSNTRTLLIFVFSLDRFFSVFAPFSYPKFGLKIVSSLCIATWVVSITISSILLPPSLDCYSYSNSILFCSYDYACNRNCQVFNLVYMLIVILPSIFVPVGFFIALYIKGRIIIRKSSIMTGTSLKSAEQEKRALKTFVLLLTAVFIVVFPPIIFNNLAKLFGDIAREVVLKITINFVPFLVITDPIIIMRNADVNKALHKLVSQLKDRYFKSWNCCAKNNSNKPIESPPQKTMSKSVELSTITGTQ